jgi:hypothetical protein
MDVDSARICDGFDTVRERCRQVHAVVADQAAGDRQRRAVVQDAAAVDRLAVRRGCDSMVVGDDAVVECQVAESAVEDAAAVGFTRQPEGWIDQVAGDQRVVECQRPVVRDPRPRRQMRPSRPHRSARPGCRRSRCS